MTKGETSALDKLPSQARNRPLSLRELQDIRALIGAAKGSGGNNASKKSTFKSANNATSKCEPLTGRRVMVPITSKAFFEGMLEPPIKLDSPSDSNISDVAMNERVTVHVGAGYHVEMTRAESCRFFDKQVELQQLAHNKKKAAIASVPKNQSGKKSSVTPKKRSTNSATRKEYSGKNDHILKTLSGNEFTEEASLDPALPFMEIREECDSGGNIVRSEIVNMTHEMKRLDETFKQAAISGESEDEGKKIGKLLAQTLKESEGSIIAFDDVPDTNDSTIENDDREQISDGNKPTQPTDDDQRTAEYEALRLRLEELERLEEEDAKSKKGSANSSKRLQSRGWSKGFLNANKKKTVKTTFSSVGQQFGNNEKSKIPNKMTDTKPSTIGDKSIQQDIPTKIGSRVSFSAQNEVKEIPRIGQSKVPQRSAPLIYDPTKLEVPENFADPFPPVSTAPFEENVFGGVVKERGASVSDSLIENRNVEKVVSPSNSDDGAGKKKLSRFAQQRLQRGM